MALTYSQLVTQIRNYTEVDSNGLSDSTLSVVVQNAENRIYREEFNNLPGNSTYYAKPRYYANFNETTWFVAPTPNTTYAINIAYYSQGTSITAGSSTTSTTYISTFAQDLLLYGSLVETYKYLKGPDNMIQVYEQSYQQARESFGVEQTGRRRRDEYVDGEPRVVVDSPPPSNNRS